MTCAVPEPVIVTFVAVKLSTLKVYTLPEPPSVATPLNTPFGKANGQLKVNVVDESAGFIHWIMKPPSHDGKAIYPLFAIKIEKPKPIFKGDT